MLDGALPTTLYNVRRLRGWKPVIETYALQSYGLRLTADNYDGLLKVQHKRLVAFAKNIQQIILFQERNLPSEDDE